MELWRSFCNCPCDLTPYRKGYKYRATNKGEESLWGFVRSVSWYAKCY
ncbi:hypothetical protein AVEN_17234-1, partial [Araneus ventricosus]